MSQMTSNAKARLAKIRYLRDNGGNFEEAKIYQSKIVVPQLSHPDHQEMLIIRQNADELIDEMNQSG